MDRWTAEKKNALLQCGKVCIPVCARSPLPHLHFSAAITARRVAVPYGSDHAVQVHDPIVTR